MKTQQSAERTFPLHAKELPPHGRVAQSVEHSVYIRAVAGSSPAAPTPPFSLVPLTRGYSAKISPEDLPLVSGFKWYVKPARNTAYAIRSSDGKRMHNVILAPPAGMLADHADGDGLNNTRLNLRLATPLQNNHNRRHEKTGTSRFKGVSWRSKERNWRAQICIDGRRICLGNFQDEEKAAQLYDFVAAQFFGAFARLNFPEGQTAFPPVSATAIDVADEATTRAGGSL